MSPTKNFNVNSRTIVAPVAAFTMAALLFVYTRTSIKAAKRNAQVHREADGGQISWKNESRRRHGKMKVEEQQGEEEEEEGKKSASAGQEEIKARKRRRERSV
ncbi:hypothetical protein MMC14_000189 [Varicellaria rhodocarpa]|nr:hypothetical protein [Varicellaria rhodocarpa]